MYDKELTVSILQQIDTAIEVIKTRTTKIKSCDDFTGSPEGMEKLDGICMLFMAIGESIKAIDKITSKKIIKQVSTNRLDGNHGISRYYCPSLL